MTDIVERLRGKPVRHDYFPEADRQEAADEIERLQDLLWQEAGNRVEIERLQGVLDRCDRYRAYEVENLLAERVEVVEELQAEVERLRAALAAERERCANRVKELLSGLGIDHIAAEVSDRIRKGE